jgi:hypothetical protein
MIDKYNKYWRTIPHLYCIAFILDPRAKIKGFNAVLRKLHLLTDADYGNKLAETRTLLFKLYHKYDDLYGSVREKRAAPPSLSGKKKTAWADIYMMMMYFLLILICPGVFLLLPCFMQQLLLHLLDLNSHPIWIVTLSVSMMMTSTSCIGGISIN